MNFLVRLQNRILQVATSPVTWIDGAFIVVFGIGYGFVLSVLADAVYRFLLRF